MADGLIFVRVRLLQSLFRVLILFSKQSAGRGHIPRTFRRPSWRRAGRSRKRACFASRLATTASAFSTSGVMIITTAAGPKLSVGRFAECPEELRRAFGRFLNCHLTFGFLIILHRSC